MTKEPKKLCKETVEMNGRIARKSAKKSATKTTKRISKKLTALLLCGIMVLSGFVMTHTANALDIEESDVEAFLDTNLNLDLNNFNNDLNPDTEPPTTITDPLTDQEAWALGLYYYDAYPKEGPPADHEALAMGYNNFFAFTQYANTSDLRSGENRATTDAYVTIIYYGDNYTGGTVPDSHIVNTPNRATLQHPGTMTKEGYIFAGWRSSADDMVIQPGIDIDFIGDGTIVFTAVWVPSTTENNAFVRSVNATTRIQFNGGGHTGGTVPTAFNITTPGSFIMPFPGTLSRTGHVFVGWASSMGGTWQPGWPVGFAAPVQGTVTYTAVWSPVNNIVTVQFNGNGNTSGWAPSSLNVATPGLSGILPGQGNLLRTGFTFSGWQSSAGQFFSAGQRINFTTTQSGTLTLFAVWTPNASVTLSFDGNGGTPTWQTLQRQPSATMGNMPTQPTRTGFNFAGWFNTPSTIGGTQLHSWSTVPNTSTTYWARWTPQQVVVPSVTLNNISNINIGQQITVSGSATQSVGTPWRMAARVDGPGLPPNGQWLGDVFSSSYSRTFTPPQTGTYTVTLFARSFPDGTAGANGLPTTPDPRSGQGSVWRTFNVAAAQTISISATPSAPTFGSHPVGYSQRPTQTITITNTGNANVTLASLPNVPNWTLSAGNNWTTAMAQNQTRTFTIRPDNNLAAGIYNPSFDVTGSGGARVTIQPTFTVTAAVVELRVVGADGEDFENWSPSAASDSTSFRIITDPPTSGATVTTSLTTGQNWLRVNGSGNNWTLTVDENLSTTGRPATVTVSVAGVSHTISVMQSGRREVNVTLVANGGRFEGPGNVTRIERSVLIGTSLNELPRAVRDGFEFIGWFTEQIGGVQVTTVPANNIMLHAGWRPITVITIPYQVRVNGTTSGNRALSNIDAVKDAFMREFAINLVSVGEPITSVHLNPKDGCLHFDRCTPACGVHPNGADCLDRHHRSSDHFVRNAHPGSRATASFMYVDFQLCLFGPAPHWGHRGVHGAANERYYSMIVSMHPTADNPIRTTAHEISHLFGASDPAGNYRCEAGQPCVMNPDFHNIDHGWCTRCRTDIVNNRHRPW